MKTNTVKLLIVAACFTLPFCGAELMAKEHHHREQNIAAEIIDAVARLLNPRPAVVVHPAPPPVVHHPAPPPVVVHHTAPVVVYRHTPPPPPKPHHAPAPRPHGKGHRR